MRKSIIFFDCIVNDQEPMIGIPDAFKTHEIAFAAERSADTGKPVSLPLSIDWPPGALAIG